MFAFSLLSFGLLLTCLPSRAQTGDHWQIDPPIYTCTPSSTGNAHIGQTTPNSVNGGGSPPGTLTIAGTATITCKWVSAVGTPAPKQVIVQENMVGSGGFYQSGQAVYTGPAPVVRYSLTDSSSGSFTLTSPQMTATVTLQSTGGAIATVTYSVTLTATTLTLNLTGTVLDASKADHILIGQQAGAYLDAGTTGYSVTNIQWKAVGNTLQGWTGVQNGTTGAPYGLANPYTLNQSSLSQSKPAWYWSDVQGNKAVSCTATVTPPAGQGAAFTLNATRNIFLDVPAWSEGESSNPTRVDSQFPPITGPALWAGTTIQYQNGSQWSDGVTITPTIYPTTGDWAHLQIISVKGTHSAGGTATPVPNNGVTGLDGGFPYRVDGSYYKDNGTIVRDDGDSPGINLLDAYDTYSLNYSFDLYVMYYPPGATAIPVPLTKLTWTWKPNVTRPASGHWAIGAATIAPNSNLTVPTMGTRCIDEPAWTIKINPH